VFSSDRMREPTLQFDEHYEKQMDELIELMIGVCDSIKKGQEGFHG